MSSEKKNGVPTSETRCCWRWLNRLGLALLAAVISHSSTQIVAAQNRLVKLDPEPLVVQLENGQGTVDVTFALAQGTAVPEFRVTPAVGISNRIPASDISFTWTTSGNPQSGTQQSLLAGQLTVKTSVNIEPDTNYAGQLVFYWPDATPPILVKFTASDRAKLAFSIAPTKFELVLVQFQPDTMLIRVKNTGRVAIKSLSISSSDLLDSETQRRLVLPDQIKDFGSVPLPPSHETEIPFKVAPPIWAGTYVGSLDVVANGRERQSIAFSLRTRGPAPARNTYWVPFALFVATLLVGYLLSNLLEKWFNLGGLQRAEAQVSLRKSESELTRIAQQVETWTGPPGSVPESVFAQTRVRLHHDLNELRELYRRIVDLTREELVAEAKRFGNAATLAGIFESAVNVAFKQWPDQPMKLNEVLASFDREMPGADPSAYRARLRAILEAAAKPEADVTKVGAFDARSALPDRPSPAELERRIKWMAHLERFVAAVVVFIMAYQLFYVRDFSFGTLLDYLGVFLWSLGLTQMGTQLIARARSSYTPSQ